MPRAQANHPPAARLAHADRLRARSGERIPFSAAGSSDPDGDALSYEWIYYREPGSFATNRPLTIDNAKAPDASLVAPKVSKPETIHVVLAVTDGGAPSLTRYRRVIVTVYP
jgi:hypothetical protein